MGRGGDQCVGEEVFCAITTSLWEDLHAKVIYTIIL